MTQKYQGILSQIKFILLNSTIQLKSIYFIVIIDSQPPSNSHDSKMDSPHHFFSPYLLGDATKHHLVQPYIGMAILHIDAKLSISIPLTFSWPMELSSNWTLSDLNKTNKPKMQEWIKQVRETGSDNSI